MDIDLPNVRHYSISTGRSSNGCWTCRLRRKKCDEKRPVCDVCAALHITCNNDREKPEWMDGGIKQQEMAEQYKREVKEQQAHRRQRGERTSAVYGSGGSGSSPKRARRGPSVSDFTLPSPISTTSPGHGNTSSKDGLDLGSEVAVAAIQQLESRNAALGNVTDMYRPLGQSDTILATFFLEYLFPFLFPFYRPSIHQGGNAWILQMMVTCPLVRQATLCQSSYFFSLARGTTHREVVWDLILSQTREAFSLLRRALQIICDSDVSTNLRGAVRLMASIMQVQRFEIAVSSFDNCQAHLSAALALFDQMLESVGAPCSATAAEEISAPGMDLKYFNALMSRLGPSPWILPAQEVQVPSAEEAAFRFSSALLIFDDIIASTVLQEGPRLHKYHRCLLASTDGVPPFIDLEGVVGCQNWVLMEIGEIAALDAWKQRCRKAGNLDVMELVRRATAIKDSLETHLRQLETEPAATDSKTECDLLDVFRAEHLRRPQVPIGQGTYATQVWAHGALAYLSVVVSGWQPASPDVRFYTGQTIALLTCQTSPPALLRTMVWPFCVAGCLAEPAQEARLRGMVEALQPSSVFGTLHKALAIMENAWSNRHTEDASSRDLATCFRSQGELVLLV